MNIIVKAPLMADKIKDLLNGGTFDGVLFQFVGKTGMLMTFEASADNIQTLDPAAIAKKAIKATDYGKGLYFSVENK